MADANKSKSSALAKAEAKAEKIVNGSSKKAKSSDKNSRKQNPVVKYFKELKSELKKVVWPSRPKVINNTTVVVVGMCVIGVAIWGIDSGLAALLKLIINIGK